MIARYRLLSERLRVELGNIALLVQRAEGALQRAKQQPADQDYFLSSAALDLHSFYAGVERLFELIAVEVDGSKPAGGTWHNDLLAQMALQVPALRPAVLTAQTRKALEEYLKFRHVVRNVYTFNLKPARVAELVHDLRATYEQTQRDLLNFTTFLDALSTADEDND